MRQLVVRAVSPIVWRVPGHGARKLRGFARAEQASRIDLLQAAQHTESLERRALYLRHALDEARHATMFWRRANELAVPAPPPVADTEDLYDRLGERRFLAFVHLGEQRGRRQFEVYARQFASRGDARTAAMFDGILVDEQRHERYTRELLVGLCGEAGARRELRRARLWNAWRLWRRAGRTLAGAVYTVLMTVLFFVVGPLATATLRLRSERAARRARWQLPAPARPLPVVEKEA